MRAPFMSNFIMVRLAVFQNVKGQMKNDATTTKMTTWFAKTAENIYMYFFGVITSWSRSLA